MPVYAYVCTNCGTHFERRQSFDDKPVKLCPECRGKVRRLIQPAGVIFKGSGFYSTDHKSAPTSTGAASAKSDAPIAEKTDGKSDGKPETKAENKPESKSESKSENKPARKKEKAAAAASD